ncbi:MAG: hypothetical protein WC730_01055 [Patescibacteria group bacterium]|jgi:hypothetical protein
MKAQEEWKSITFDTTQTHHFDPWDDLKIDISPASKQALLPGVAKRPIKIRATNHLRDGSFEFQCSWRSAKKKDREKIYRCHRKTTIIIYPNPILTIKWRFLKNKSSPA